jgi:hypothetical protein
VKRILLIGGKGFLPTAVDRELVRRPVSADFSIH